MGPELERRVVLALEQIGDALDKQNDLSESAFDLHSTAEQRAARAPGGVVAMLLRELLLSPVFAEADEREFSGGGTWARDWAARAWTALGDER